MRGGMLAAMARTEARARSPRWRTRRFHRRAPPWGRRSAQTTCTISTRYTHYTTYTSSSRWHVRGRMGGMARAVGQRQSAKGQGWHHNEANNTRR